MEAATAVTVMVSESRRPIRQEETFNLKQLGREVRAFRRRVGLSQQQLADRALLHKSALSWIETGQRRTRASTLRRIAQALVNSGAHVDVEHLVSAFVDRAGDALAPESDYAERVDRRRRERFRRQINAERERLRAEGR